MYLSRLTRLDKYIGLSKVFKAKMLQALRNRKVSIPNADMLMASPWCTYSKAFIIQPETVIQYLSRCTQQRMLSETRLHYFDKQHVTFSYRDYRQPTNLKIMTLSGVEFVRRYASHILPKEFIRVSTMVFFQSLPVNKTLTHSETNVLYQTD